MAHANARLTPIGRFTLVARIESGRAVADVAAEESHTSSPVVPCGGDLVWCHTVCGQIVLP